LQLKGNNSLSIGNSGLGTFSNGLWVSNSMSINQNNSALAAPTLYLTQSDVSEEFIEFNGTVATGNPIDTAAVGAYAGKLRISVNGTFRYVPFYNS
jgi:hypothetical protein